ncbi:alkene reductase [Chitinophaga silvisoli]|uniref:Alkene reductase n=1 Tax=Chitinophaga silvisoli TaxID=2291814 RepID=A0A3E1P080_9BACT|nr:alkene reductase [Chitinophaga silvisoli]RFM33524.1 alkene reductase [Chitinophaga silvisoli]
MNKLLMPYEKGALQLKNHLVMAPMTRSRAINNLPNSLMATYYAQRNGAGLIITEGTAPSPNALGYSRIPGIFSKEQTMAWKEITAAVHAGGSRIFLQLMHTGRIGHPANLPAGARLVGPSTIKAAGEIWTDSLGLQPYPTPEMLSGQEIPSLIAEFVTAAQNAIEAGFDGVELHGANGYLVEQFLNPHVNNRTDEWGGSVENRARLAIRILQEMAAAIGAEKVGIRFSPFSTLGDLPAYDEQEVSATYALLATELNKLNIAYLHLGISAIIPQQTLDAIRSGFAGTIILCNGLTPETAEAALNEGFADLVAFGRAFLANPDLDRRIAENAELNQPDYNTLYTPGPEGYTDYASL